jgi:hypothetical protein
MVTVAGAAYDAGVRSPVPLAQATAIAMAESGGNERAHNRIPPDDSYGLWQINMRGDLGEERRRRLGLTSNEDLYDVATNARAMFAISNSGNSWQPWTTFGGARYLLYYPAAQAVSASVIAAKAGQGFAAGARDAVQDITDPIEDAVDAAVGAATGLKQAAAWLGNRDNWFRVAKVAAGLALVGVGVFGLTRPLEVADKVLQPVKGIL